MKMLDNGLQKRNWNRSLESTFSNWCNINVSIKLNWLSYLNHILDTSKIISDTTLLSLILLSSWFLWPTSSPLLLSSSAFICKQIKNISLSMQLFTVTGSFLHRWVFFLILLSSFLSSSILSSLLLLSIIIVITIVMIFIIIILIGQLLHILTTQVLSTHLINFVSMSHL